MSQSKRSPKEFIQECFPPRLAVLWSQDAHDICQKNNLNFIQLLQPFCRPNAELIASDLTNHRFYLKNFFLHLSTIEQAVPPNPNITRNIFHSRVAKTVEAFDERNVSQIDVHVRDTILRIPAVAPWYEAFRDDYIRLFPLSDHECIRDFLGCLFVVSTSAPDPIARAKLLLEQQVQQQANQKYPRWFGPNTLKFFVVLDDASIVNEESKSRGDTALHYFASTYGESNCCLLRINSRRSNDEPSTGNAWSVLAREEVKQSSEMLNGSAEEKKDSVDGAVVDTHPLSPSFQGKMDVAQPEVGNLLSSEDAEGIREFIIDLVNKCLIPYAEKQIKSLNELIISKKGIHRTLVNFSSKLLGPKGPPKGMQKAGSGGNLSQVVYVGEAVELQNRKAGDLSFMFQMYDQAFQFYQSARRDYSNDQAWNYYAAASEMCGLSVFLSPTAGFSHSNAKGFPLQYFDAAVKSYSDMSKMAHHSYRAVLLASEVCRALHLYLDAANFYKSRTLDDFDLLYGLFLEQAGHCYLRLPLNPSPRKFTFQMIFAGFRYFKAGQKRLGILTYSNALKVLEGRGWMVAEDHIRIHIIRHAMALKLYSDVLQHFRPLLTGIPRQSAAQQYSILKDFIFCHKFVHGDATTDVNLPVISCQDIRTVIGSASDFAASAVEVVDEQWSTLEEKTVAVKGNIHPVFKHQQFIFNSVTDNRHHPVSSVGEIISVEIPLKNPLGTAIFISHIVLNSEFRHREGSPNDGDLHVTAQPSEISLAPLSSSTVSFLIQVDHPGSFKITSLSYTLFVKSETEEEIINVRGEQKLSLRGWRLNKSNAEQKSVVYALDRRLDLIIIPPRGKLVAKWENFPKGVLAGQVVRLGLTIENQGRRAVDHVAIASSLPDVLLFFGCPNEQGVITLQIPNGTIEPGKKVVLTAVFMAPACPGSYSLKSLLYYESVPLSEDRDKTHKYRVWRVQHDFDVFPGVTLRGSSQSVGPAGRDLLTTLQVAHVNEVQLESLPFALVEILSTDPSWEVRNLSSPFSDEGLIYRNEERFISLYATQHQEAPSAALSGFTIAANLDAADHSFVKAARRFVEIVNRSDKRQLGLRLLWKITLSSDGRPTSVYGTRSITLPLATQTTPDIAEILSKFSHDKFLAGPSQLVAVEEPLNMDVIDWRVECKEMPQGGWKNTNVVPMSLRLVCSSVIATATFHVNVEFRTAVRSFPVGVRRQMLTMRAGDVQELPFVYCFMTQGTYNMAEFVSVKAICDVIPELKVPKLQKPSNNQMLFKVG
ncbi:trafficking protein particle complex subunit 8-like [Paramacrobiotus metropolitanus]|uniref:trafficking protein particle complex subunit 8-like n=1 Tax=Paramacrobiotus metropolitanus TaxID=2943436 RepID=UPI0024458E5D|nr:trafficking protein particle complex subunit 8-like [Paramacrobiotus metropolitanus]XP_055355048.1 trafficking protein particle complex subunit 8-like [Paramacrobiotus metropolitanus]